MKSVLALLLMCLLTLPVSYFVEANGFAKSNTKASQQLRVKSARQAAQLAKSRLGGKVLKVQSQNVNGQRGYRVKLIKNDGHIVSVFVDAKSGRLIGR